MLNIFAEALTERDDTTKQFVLNSHSYPLIKELCFRFHWRVGDVRTDTKSIESGKASFIMFDKYRVPVVEVFTDGDYNHDTGKIENIKYVVESSYLVASNRKSHKEIISHKIPYIIKALKDRLPSIESPITGFANAARNVIGQYERWMINSFGKVDVNLHTMGLNATDIFMLLNSYFNRSPLTDENKYKAVLDIFESARNNKDAMQARLRECLTNPFYFIHSSGDTGVYVTKLVSKEGSYQEFEMLEPPRYAPHLRDLEDELPVLTMMKVMDESEGAGGGFASGIPRKDKYYDDLEINTYYNYDSYLGSVYTMVVPCPTL
jgi:hypothetical protein